MAVETDAAAARGAHGGKKPRPLDAQLQSKHLLSTLAAKATDKKGASVNRDTGDAVAAAPVGVPNPLLARRINFVESTAPDRAYEDLRKKYRPINADAVRTAGGKAAQGAPAAPAGGETVLARDGPQILDPALIPRDWRSMHPAAPGLGNLGNTCFLNSSLQCLAHTPPLAEYLLSGHHSRSCATRRGGTGFCMTCDLENFVGRCFGSRAGGPFSPRHIVENLRMIGKQFKMGRQEDAHEFVRMVVDAMQNSDTKTYMARFGIKKVEPKLALTTLPSHLFGGLLRSRLTCQTCGHTSDTHDPFMDLPLDLSSSSVSGCLAGFVRPEILRGKDAYWTCEKCARRVEARKEVRIERGPRVLVVQLKRFGYTKGHAAKVARRVRIDRQLDIAPYSVSPEAGTYDLYALTLHHGGSMRSGHYTAFVKAANGVWWHMDDERRSQVGWERVDREGQEGAYLAWYVRRDVGAEAGREAAAEKAERPAKPEKAKPAGNGPAVIADIFGPPAGKSKDKQPDKKEPADRKPDPRPAWAQAPSSADVGEKLGAAEAKELEKALLKKRKREEGREGEPPAKKRAEDGAPRGDVRKEEGKLAGGKDAPSARKENADAGRKEGPAQRKEAEPKGVPAAATSKEAPKPGSSAATAKANRDRLQATQKANWKIGPAAPLRSPKNGGVEARWIVTDLAPAPAATKKRKLEPSTPAAEIERLPSPPRTEPTRTPQLGQPLRRVASESSSSDDDEPRTGGAVFPRPPPIDTSAIAVAWDAPMPAKRAALDAVIRGEAEHRRRSAASMASSGSRYGTPDGDVLRELVEDGKAPRVELWTPDGASPVDRWGSAGAGGKIGVRPSSYDAEYDKGKGKKVKSADERREKEELRKKGSAMFAKLGEEASRKRATEQGRMEEAMEAPRRLGKVKKPSALREELEADGSDDGDSVMDDDQDAGDDW